MKFRSGFVSNSSSSSFVLVATKDAYERAFNSLSEEDQEALKSCFNSEELFGKDVVVIATVGDHGGSYISGSEGGAWEAFESYQNALGNDPAEVWSHSEDW